MGAPLLPLATDALTLTIAGIQFLALAVHLQGTLYWCFSSTHSQRRTCNLVPLQSKKIPMGRSEV